MSERKLLRVDYSVAPALPLKASSFKHPSYLSGEVQINLQKVRLISLPRGSDINTILRRMNGSLDDGRFLDQRVAETYVELCNKDLIDPIQLGEDLSLPASARLFWSGTIHNNGVGRLIPVTFTIEKECRKRFYHSSENIPPDSFLVFLRA